MTAGRLAESLNFSWVIDKELAGSAAPMFSEQLSHLKSQGIRAILRLAYPGKDDYVLDAVSVRDAGLVDRQIPVEDYSAPNQDQIREAVAFIEMQLRAKKPVAVSCGAGCGRTGTILACYLVARGYTAKDAIETLRAKRPCSIETPPQEESVYEFEKSLQATEASR
jgi:atypical dual specificity phosphatase